MSTRHVNVELSWHLHAGPSWKTRPASTQMITYSKMPVVHVCANMHIFVTFAQNLAVRLWNHVCWKDTCRIAHHCMLYLLMFSAYVQHTFDRLWRTEYRAMFVQNCKIDVNEELREGGRFDGAVHPVRCATCEVSFQRTLGSWKTLPSCSYSLHWFTYKEWYQLRETGPGSVLLHVPCLKSHFHENGFLGLCTNIWLYIRANHELIPALVHDLPVHSTISVYGSVCVA